MSQTIFLLIIILTSIDFCAANDPHDKILSRKKRYLAFPEGASLSIAICMTAQMGITPGELFTEGVNWGISYDLPNDTKVFKEYLGKPADVLRRRNRRDLYTKLETIMRSMGYDGRNCILRALCEASRRFKPKGDSLVDEILRIVFRYPKKYTSNEETETHYQYYRASQKGIAERECSEIFPGCPFSLIDLALGYYSSLGHYP